jgi:hypothetical protein
VLIGCPHRSARCAGRFCFIVSRVLRFASDPLAGWSFGGLGLGFRGYCEAFLGVAPAARANFLVLWTRAREDWGAVLGVAFAARARFFSYFG